MTDKERQRMTELFRKAGKIAGEKNRKGSANHILTSKSVRDAIISVQKIRQRKNKIKKIIDNIYDNK